MGCGITESSQYVWQRLNSVSCSAGDSEDQNRTPRLPVSTGAVGSCLQRGAADRGLRHRHNGPPTTKSTSLWLPGCVALVPRQQFAVLRAFPFAVEAAHLVCHYTIQGTSVTSPGSRMTSVRRQLTPGSTTFRPPSPPAPTSSLTPLHSAYTCMHAHACAMQTDSK
jgi:hypothetical protein